MTSGWKDRLLHLGHRIEHRWDGVRRAIKQKLGRTGPATILPFRGYGDGQRLRLAGRVLESKGIEERHVEEGAWRNLMYMLHRFESDEVPGARVRATCGRRKVDVICDDEGYFDVAIDGLVPHHAGSPDPRWREVDLELLEPLRPDSTPVHVTGHVVVPPPSAAFAVVSDIDDTILKTGATSLTRSLRTTLLSSARSRSPFAGVRAFYRALERGTRGQPTNPIFYVSSSPWNLYDFLERFMAINDIPAGPILLRDLGWDRSKFITGRHDDHKLQAIERLLAFYPALRFILIGDSGQHDPAIYRQVVERHPDRVLAVYIRDLSRHPGGHGETRALLDEVREAGIAAALSPDLLPAAEDAAAQGWITAEAVTEVRREVAAAS